MYSLYSCRSILVQIEFIVGESMPYSNVFLVQPVEEGNPAQYVEAKLSIDQLSRR